MNIEDGKGTGYKAAVNSENEIEVRAQVTGRAEWVCHNKEQAYAMYFSQAQANSGGNECLGYIKNTSDDDLVIDEISLYTTAADHIYISKVTGTAAGGSAITPVNLNIGSGKTAPCTTMQHTAITGLTDAGRLVHIYLAANGMVVREMETSILIRKNSAIALYVTTQQVNTVKANFWFHFEDAH